MFKLFEKMSEHDRERQLNELLKREDSQCVPPAVQELEIAAEPPEGAEEQSAEAAQTQSSSSDAGDAPAKATVSPQPDRSSSSSSSGQLPEGEQGAAASTSSTKEWEPAVFLSIKAPSFIDVYKHYLYAVCVIALLLSLCKSTQNTDADVFLFF